VERNKEVSAGRNHTRATGTRARPQEIESRSQMRSATGGQCARARRGWVDGGAHRGPASVNPHRIPVSGAPVPQSRVVHTSASTAAISGASAVFRGFRPASHPTATLSFSKHLRNLLRSNVLN
jgi:hypothetical protein